MAIWATSWEPGSPLALMDQGRLFDPPADARAVHLVTDETGLPAIRGILRGLPADATGTAIIEVPVEEDVTELVAPVGVTVRWLSRSTGTHSHGAAALAELERVTAHPDDYAFVVGESKLATGGRRALHRAGLPKPRITFSGFWKAH